MIIVTCAHCGQSTDQSPCVDPSDDDNLNATDASICFGCGEFSVFGTCPCCGQLTSCIPTPEEAAIIETHPAMIIARQARAENHSPEAALEEAWRKVRE